MMHIKKYGKNLLLLILLFVSGKAITQNKNPNASYQAPAFEATDRLQRLEPLFPLVKKMYQEYAEKNHFPGYAFGVMLDGKLVYSGSGGYSDIESKTAASTKTFSG